LHSISWKEDTGLRRTEELKRHLTHTVRVVLEDPTRTLHDYNIKVPTLIDKQFFYIGGYLKIPIFQLIDDPVLFKSQQSGVRLRTNVLSIGMTNECFNLFGKKIPIHELITSLYSVDEFRKFVADTLNDKCNLREKEYDRVLVKEESDLTIPHTAKGPYNKPFIINLWKECMDKYKSLTDQERLERLGSYFSKIKHDEEKKGNNIKFSLTQAANVDYFSARFFKTNSVVFELVRAYIDGFRSDTDVKNKRIRFSEYILAPLIKKVYDMIVTIYNNKKPEYKIPQSIILDECNVNQLIHFNNSINPVSELAALFQCSLVGTGGFKKASVPSHLKDLDRSQFGYICPADTPDRDGCGVVLNMTSITEIDDLGKFKKNSSDVVTSYPISLVPFLQNDDQTRLQMSSNQYKQAIVLKNSEPPLVKSGLEDKYLNHGSFLYRAEKKGVVLDITNKYIIIGYDYDDKSKRYCDCRVIKTGYREDGVFDCLEPVLKEGSSFNPGDIICQSAFIKDGSLTLGQNLLTGICIWEGLNYEDGVVISESVSKTKFTSVHPVDLSFEIDPSQVLLSLENNDYIPLPDIGTVLSEGQTYAKLKHINTDENLESLNIDPYELKSPTKCKIVSIEFYVNKWNRSIDGFDTFIKVVSNNQSSKFLETKNKLQKFIGIDQCDDFMLINGLTRLDTSNRVGKYTNKGSKLKGILVKIKAIYEEEVSVGDKIANRHGNKGVISRIIPDNEMPFLEDGRRLDIIINPLGILSRMNVGQIFELHLGETIYQLKQQLDRLRVPKSKIDKVRKVLECLHDTKNSFAIDDVLNKFDPNNLDTLNFIIPPFLGPHPKQLKKVMELVGSKQYHKVFNPKTQSYFKSDISVGYIYFLKLMHRATDKTSARSIGPYTSKTLQPMGGKHNKGGHRLGEMEVWSMLAHGADDLLEHMLTTHSDSTKRKNMLLSEILDNPNLISEDEMGEETPQSNKLFNAYLNLLGINIKTVDEKELKYD